MVTATLQVVAKPRQTYTARCCQCCISRLVIIHCSGQFSFTLEPELFGCLVASARDPAVRAPTPVWSLVRKLCMRAACSVCPCSRSIVQMLCRLNSRKLHFDPPHTNPCGRRDAKCCVHTVSARKSLDSPRSAVRCSCCGASERAATCGFTRRAAAEVIWWPSGPLYTTWPLGALPGKLRGLPAQPILRGTTGRTAAYGSPVPCDGCQCLYVVVAP